jgi:hypothetical protein
VAQPSKPGASAHQTHNGYCLFRREPSPSLLRQCCLLPEYSAGLNAIALWLNQRPRKTLGFQTPADRLQAVLHGPVERTPQQRTFATQALMAGRSSRRANPSPPARSKSHRDGSRRRPHNTVRADVIYRDDKDVTRPGRSGEAFHPRELSAGTGSVGAAKLIPVFIGKRTRAWQSSMRSGASAPIRHQTKDRRYTRSPL